MEDSKTESSQNVLATSVVSDEDSDINKRTASSMQPTSLLQPANTTTCQFLAEQQKGNFTQSLKCLVCNDVSSGKHYGVLACNGCSGFFKRSVRRKLIYRCQVTTGTCVVDKAHRNQCQACRLKKCLKVGMNKYAVQNERQPRSLSTLKSKDQVSGNLSSKIESVCVDEKSLGEMTFAQPTNHGQQAKTIGNSNGLIAEMIQPHGKSSKRPREENESFDWTTALQNPHFVTACAPFCCTADETASYTYATWQEPVYESSARILFLAVRWARNLPAYTNLAFRDQVILLEETWPKLFVISAIQWSMPLDSSPLFIMDSNVLTQRMADPKNVSMAQKTLQSLQKTLARFKHLGVDLAEFACLKAILLFQADTRGLKDASKIEALQDHAQLMLSEHVHSKSDETLRFGRLLLLLQSIYEVRSETLEHLFFHKINGCVPIERMLCDMFKY